MRPSMPGRRPLRASVSRRRRALAIAALALPWLCAGKPPTLLAATPEAPDLALPWEVTAVTSDARGDGQSSHARFTLSNNGSVPLPSGWTLWFTAVGNSVTADPAYPVRNEGGTLFALDSPATLPALAPGASTSFPIEHPDELLVAEKGPAGPFLTLPGDPGRAIAIHGYTRIGPRRTTPGIPDGLFAGVEDTFRANLAAQAVAVDAPADQAMPPVLPAPKAWRVSPTASVPVRRPVVRIAPVPGERSPEAYRLVVSRRDGIVITGASRAGAWYGLRTLEQLLATARREGGLLHELEISDAPRYGHRGLMIDIARNFRGPEELGRILDVMAAFKLNRLPAPGAIAHDGVVEANYAWPGVTLHYTRDGSAPDAGSPVLEGKVPAGGVLRIIAVTSGGRASPEASIDSAAAVR